MSESINKKSFKVEIDGVEKEFAVIRPGFQQQQQGAVVYAKKYKEVVTDGVPITEEMEKLLLPKIWDNKKQEESDSIVRFLLNGEKRLAAGGNKMTVDGVEMPGLSYQSARELAIQMRLRRVEFQILNSDKNKLYQHTAESFSEQARFDHYMSVCTLTDGGSRYFKDVDDYLARADNDPVAPHAQQHLMSLLFPVDVQGRRGLPENKYLVANGYADDQLRLVDRKSKHLVDISGKPINDHGQWLNDEGQPVDSEGNRITETGEYKIDFVPFIDEESEPNTVVEKENSSAS